MPDALGDLCLSRSVRSRWLFTVSNSVACCIVCRAAAHAGRSLKKSVASATWFDGKVLLRCDRH